MYVCMYVCNYCSNINSEKTMNIFIYIINIFNIAVYYNTIPYTVA